MSDMNIHILEIKGGAVLMINPPINPKKFINVKFINKIAKADQSFFLFPALYGNFHCEEDEIISDKVYESYEALRKNIAYENIFVFEASEIEKNTDKTYKSYSINSLISYAEAVILAQNTVTNAALSASFKNFLQSPFYLDFISEYSFTASEIIIINGLLKYAFLSDIIPDKLIAEIKENLEPKANIKLLRKEILYALRQRLS